jgi:hypothetical protein
MRFLVTLLLFAGIISGFYLFENWRRERTDRYWAGECRKWVEPLARRQAGSASLQPDEAAFFRMLYLLQKARAAGVDLSKMVSDACDALDLQDGAGLVKESIEASYEMAKRLQLFDDIGNMISLERGEPAFIRAVGWQDEKIAVAQVVPPLLAPEAARHLANLQLMPACVRDAQGETVTAFGVDRARALERAHVIGRESLERVLAAGPAAR